MGGVEPEDIHPLVEKLSEEGLFTSVVGYGSHDLCLLTFIHTLYYDRLLEENQTTFQYLSILFNIHPGLIHQRLSL